MGKSDHTISGAAGGAPELRFSDRGVPVCNISVAVNLDKKEGDTWVPWNTTWYRVEAWAELAEALNVNASKGCILEVVGTSWVEQYETRDGRTGKTTKLKAKEIRIYDKVSRIWQDITSEDGENWNEAESAYDEDDAYSEIPF